MAIVEESIIQGIKQSIESGGNIFSGAWNGFKDGLKRLKVLFSRKLKDLIVPAVYGFFCAPGYGVENQGFPNSQPGVDGRDSACKAHDEGLYVRRRAKSLLLPVDSITSYDWRLIKTSFMATAKSYFADVAFGGGHRIGNIFGYTVPFAFGIRIVKNGGR